MRKLFLLLLEVFIILTPILSVPQISCKWIYQSEIPNYDPNELFSPDRGCLLVFYNQTNSHAALCSEGLNLWNSGTFPITGGVISCKIVADYTKLQTYNFTTPIEFPISFVEYNNVTSIPLSGLDIYLYYPSNSHVSLTEVTSLVGTYNGVRLSDYFSFLEFVNTTTGVSSTDIQNTTMLLYLVTDSHIADPTSNDAPIKLILHNRTDYSATTIINAPDVIVDSAIVNITDNYVNIPLQYCYYRIEGRSWIERPCYDFSFNLSVFPDGPCPIDDYCTVESLVINRVGDVYYNSTSIYTLHDPLNIIFQSNYQSLVEIINELFNLTTKTFYRTYYAEPIRVTLDIKKGALEIPFTINVISKKTGIDDLYISGTLEYVSKISENTYPGKVVFYCGEASGETIHLQNLLPGEQISCVAKIYPATVGNYRVKLNFNWYYTVQGYLFNYTYVKEVDLEVYTIGSTLLSIATMDEQILGKVIVLMVNILLAILLWS